MSTKILDILITTQEISTSELALFLGVDKKRVWYEIESLNEVLRIYDVDLIRIQSGNIFGNKNIKVNYEVLINELNEQEVIAKPLRSSAILLYTLTSKEILSVQHYEALLGLSRNSVINELKFFKQFAADKGLEFDYSRETGYNLSGEELKIRNWMERAILKILESNVADSIFRRIEYLSDFKYSKDYVTDNVMMLARKYSVVFVSERFYEMIYLLNVMSMRTDAKGIEFSGESEAYFKAQPLFEFSSILCRRLEIDENQEGVFVTTRLMAAIQGSHNFVEDKDLLRITNEVIQRMNVLTLGGLRHVDQHLLQEMLYEHLVPSYYRLKYKIPLTNQFTNTIKADYPDLFELVSRALQPLADFSGVEIPDNEIVYFTIHFGGHLRNRVDDYQNLQAITVCPNGISASILLDAQLKATFPSIDFVGIHNLENIKYVDINQYDLIFSTVPLDSDIPVFVTKPILNWVEIEMLRKQVNTKFELEEDSKVFDIDTIIKVVSKHVEIPDKEKLYLDLASALYQTRIEAEGKNLEELLKQEFIRYTDKTLNWEEGIALASQPLIEEGYIVESYIDAMIHKVKDIGPYIVLAPKVAVPHARPEDGAKKMGVSLLISEKPIQFNFEDESGDSDVQLIFVLSAIDGSSHLKALQQLSYLLENEENIDRMIKIKNSEDLYEFIKENNRNREVDL